MTNLYTLKEANIRKTWLYLFGFSVLVIGLGYFISYYFENNLIFLLVLLISLGSSFGSYWYSDKIVLALTGAKPIQKKDSPELYRLVENLCITAGLPLPKICIINDSAPNAFATGRDPEHAAVAVTTGLLQKLERVELEGVIAHELAHIGNRDTLLATIVVVLVGLIIRTTDLFFRSRVRIKSDRDKGGGLFAVLFIVFLVLAPIMAQLLRLAISRKREYLADASGALLTRYPNGLISALKKISDHPQSMKRKSNATAHLYIVNPFKGKEQKNWMVKMFATHPPVEERIRALGELEIS